MSRMKLYAHPFSNNSMRPQLSLEEKHLDYDYMKVDLFKGEHKQPAHLARQLGPDQPVYGSPYWSSTRIWTSNGTPAVTAGGDCSTSEPAAAGATLTAALAPDTLAAASNALSV